MNIQEASKLSGLSADTIRYYEKIGVVPPIARDPNGHRHFNQENINWMTVLFWLRKTGMPMKVMSHYAALVFEGDHTIAERKEILLAHRVQLANARAELDACEALLEYKLSAYSKIEGR